MPTQMAPRATPILDIQRLSRSFGAHEVITGLEAKLDPGERLALTGPNGSGKTTILRWANGLCFAQCHAVLRHDTLAAVDQTGSIQRLPINSTWVWPGMPGWRMKRSKSRM